MRGWEEKEKGRKIVNEGMEDEEEEFEDVDIGMEKRNGEIIEEIGIVIVRREEEKIDIEREGIVIKIKRILDGMRMKKKKLEIVEGRIIIEIRSIEDKEVIRDEIDERIMWIGKKIRKSSEIDRWKEKKIGKFVKMF